ncbi:U3 small nucleolar RNA-associated protein 10 [Favolaschia claudopus]|uniref:U3 small nucleolar RNA-associated protein 10 n=1 Tax=Favolaschia claudopus TaxID=2862362 RepID=A0AAW0DRS4_9AGAR
MVSSLAAQLAKGASLNTTLLVDRSRRKTAESYLFTGREADQHDLDSIHALGANGFLQLTSLNNAFQDFEEPLFSSGARETDRILLAEEAIAQLDLAISGFLALLGPYLMEAPTGKVLEWLVRRFRINEFNVQSLLALFLPYHESPHFAKMLSILHIQPNSTWSFLLPFKAAAQNVPRVALVTEMLKNSDATRFILDLLPAAVNKKTSHRTLLAFNAATIHDYLTRIKALDEGTLAHLLPALLEPLHHRSEVTKDAILGSYILLSALTQICQLTAAALRAIIAAMASSARRVSTTQFVNAVISVCEAQEQLDTLTDGAGKSVLKLLNIKQELRTAEKWRGIEKFLCPLLTTVCKRMDDEAPAFLEFLVNSPTAPTAVIKHLAHLLAVRMVSGDKDIRLQNLLACIQQTASRSDSDTQESVNEILTSLSPTQASSDDAGSVVASMGADERPSQTLGSIQDDPVELRSIQAALIARIHDTSAIVLNTLYADPALALPVFLADPKSYLDGLSTTLTSSSKPKRNILRLHLTFLLAHFCPAATPTSTEDVFHKILFPFLLFSKARQHSTDVVWELISQHPPDTIRVARWGNGQAKEDGEADATDRMTQLNTAITEKLAENIVKSDRYPSHFSDFIRKAHEIDPALSGHRLLDACAQVLEAINLQRLPDVDIPQTQTLPECLDDSHLDRIVVHKLTSKSTTHWLQVYFLSRVASVPSPASQILDWFQDESSAVDERTLYVKLMRTVYKLANSSPTSIGLTVGLLAELFPHLRDDALAFLAGVWTTSLDSAPELCVIALRHAAAFLEAHSKEADGVDFQTILPALIICLKNGDREIRMAALDCIAVQRIMVEQRFSAVYAFDAIYGESEGQLQYLAQNDLAQYVTAIMDHREHFALDPSYVKAFHVQHLGRAAIDKRTKDSDYKRNVLCCLLSHVNVLHLISAQIALLDCLEDVSDASKSEMLQPLLLALSRDPQSIQSGSSSTERFASLVVASLDSSITSALNNATSSLWDTFSTVIKRFLEPGPSSVCRTVLLQKLEQGLFAGLNIDRKVQLCNLLLEAGIKDADVYLCSKKLLAMVLHDTALAVRLLLASKPEPNSSPRASKRAKLSETSDDTLPRLSLLAEVLAGIPLPGSLDLVSRLLETLHDVVQSTTSADVDISYIEQSLMSAVEHCAEKITEIPNLTPSAIRLDILVELIRVADNPQTFNQALLLMATLARLAPDSVLHNVMPVFTFMGSNVFHRDDSYSFKVVQKTIDCIVPVMVSSLKKTHSTRSDLYLASREFIRVFTDAHNHIPRHRRTSFFGHLVDVLGPTDFLPPLCMLLIEKMANRIVRQGPDAQSSLILPISVLHRHPPALQIFTLTEVLREAQRLIARAADPEILEPSLLDTLPDEDQAQSLPTAFRRKAHALVVFVGSAAKMVTSSMPQISIPDDGTTSSLVSLLVALANDHSDSSDTRPEDISQAAHAALAKALRCMPVTDFIDAVLFILRSSDSRAQGGALDLLGERLGDVASPTRQRITPRINACLEEMQRLLVLHSDGPLVASCYKALQAIASTMGPGEEGSLTEMVPPILTTVRGRKMALPAMAALAPLSVKLGPRIIPFFRDIVTQCVALLQDGLSAVATEALNVLHGLLTSIPTFWGPAELTQVLKLCVDHRTSSQTPLTGLMKMVSKRAPTATIISALTDLWPSLQESPHTERLVRYFELLRRCLRGGSRPAVQESTRSLFNIFLEAFAFKEIAEPGSEAETETIAAFIELVVKLNEASFRPLFRRLHDWAFANEASIDLARKITFCNVYAALLDYFKGLMNPYMYFLMQPFVSVLNDYNAGTVNDSTFWTGVLDILSKSLMSDDGAFWRDDKLRAVAPALVQQVAVCVRLDHSPESKALVTDCLVALTDSATDDTLLKKLNLDLLMHTRSDEARLRVFALACATALWEAHGGKLLPFASETTTFIAECSEDEHDMVITESLRLKNALERVAGNITGL